MQIGSLIKQIDTSNNGLHEINDEELQELHKVLTTMMRDIASFCEKMIYHGAFQAEAYLEQSDMEDLFRGMTI